MLEPMIVASGKTHDHCTCTVESSPSVVDAGAVMTVRCRVACPHGCDLTGLRVSIRDQDDAELASTELTAFDGEAYVTDELVLIAPLTLEEHVRAAVLVVEENAEILHHATPTEFSFAVTAHAARINVWGIPSAIVAGERFSFKVGVKCSAGCNLSGRELSIFDHEDTQVGVGNLSDDVWPGTSALHFAEITADAPAGPGNYSWHVETPGSDGGIPHAAGSAPFAVRVVRLPDCEVMIEAVDRDKQTPIKGAQVVMHPYRTVTDENGLARMMVAKGDYKILVSGSKYVPVRTTVSVMANVTTKAELSLEPPRESPDEDV